RPDGGISRRTVDDDVVGPADLLRCALGEGVSSCPWRHRMGARRLGDGARDAVGSLDRIIHRTTERADRVYEQRALHRTPRVAEGRRPPAWQVVVKTWFGAVST